MRGADNERRADCPNAVCGEKNVADIADFRVLAGILPALIGFDVV
jgi:hypothetical protein